MPLLAEFFALGEKTAVAMPAPHRNPYNHGKHWYHGTDAEFHDDHGEYTAEHEHDEPGHTHELTSPGLAPQHDPGGQLQTPHRFDDEYGMHADKHWNTDLGVHFTSDPEVAKVFSGHGRYPESRVSHAQLHMANPKHYDSEFDMSRDAIKWGHENGYHYLDKKTRDIPEWEDHLDQGGGYGEIPGHEHLSYVDEHASEAQRRAIDDIDRRPEGREDATGPDLDAYLSLHPDREQVVSGFKEHLRSQGHDGITYGNEYEPPRGHKCAIPFEDHQINHSRWQWLHESKEHLNAGHEEVRARQDETVTSPNYFPGKGYHWVDQEGEHIGPMKYGLLQYFGSGEPLYRQPKPDSFDSEEHERRQAANPEDWSALDEAREHKNRWQREVRRAMSRGDLDPQEAWNNGYKGTGHDEQHNGSAYYHDTDRHNLAWEHMPQTLWHTTTNKSGVLAAGALKSRHELDMNHGGTGLGGGDSDTISLTDDLDVARHIHRALHEYHSVLTGKKTVQHMVDEAKEGGYLHQVISLQNGGGAQDHYEKTGELPDGMKELLRGRTIERIKGLGAKSADEIRQMHPDAEPAGHYADHPSTGRVYFNYSRPMTEDEHLDARSSHYKGHAAFREHKTGLMDPGFIFNSPKAFAETDPSQFSIIRVHPKPGARGYKVSALGEWRTSDGSAMHIGGTESPHEDEPLEKQAKTEIEAWHATKTPDWHPAIGKEWSHYGTAEAALDRAVHTDSWASHYDPYHGPRDDARIRIHKVRLSGPVYPHTLSDEDVNELAPYLDSGYEDAPEIEEKHGEPIEGYRIFPYRNVSEDKGSTSYLVHPDHARVMESHDLGPTSYAKTSLRALAKQDSGGVLPNPYHEEHNEWFHGTMGDHEDLNPQAIRDGIRPPGNGAGGPQSNKLLGVHFSALHSVAHSFAGPHRNQHGRIFHAQLKMTNPIHFEDESALLRHVWNTTMRSDHFHDEKHDGNMQWQYSAGATREGINRRLDRGRNPRDVHSAIESYLQFHPQQKEITAQYVQHLRYEGYDGITYGNHVEGPNLHYSAIAFDPKTIKVTHTDLLHPRVRAGGETAESRNKAEEPRPGSVSHDHIESIHDEPDDFLDEVNRYHNGGSVQRWGRSGEPNTGRGEWKYHQAARRRTEDIPIADLLQMALPRSSDAVDETKVAEYARQMRRHGYGEEDVDADDDHVRLLDGRVLNGNHRIHAADDAGLHSLPCEVLHHAEASKSKVKVYRGLYLADEPETFEGEVRRRFDETQPVGSHWSSDPEVAKAHAMDFLHGSGGAGMVLHGEVDPEHIMNRADIDPDRGVMSPAHFEREHFIAPGAPIDVHQTSVHWHHPETWDDKGEHVEDDWYDEAHQQHDPPLRMHAGLNGDLPEGLEYRHTTQDDLHEITAHHPQDGEIGGLAWHTSWGHVRAVSVDPAYQRRGVATELLRRAREIHPGLEHSPGAKTIQGEDWAQHTGALLPGYAHEHPWLPTGKVFAPGKGCLDARLFDQHHLMRPHVKRVIMKRLDTVLAGAYPDWQQWSRVYLAGSEASEWWGNNDFDTLVGVHYGRFRKAHPEQADLTDDEISARINAIFRRVYNDEEWKAPWDGQVWHLTGYVNPDSWNIRKIKPYAAYDMSDSRWSVKPVKVDADWGPQKWPEGTWEQMEAYLALIAAIEHLPQPEQMRQGAALYDFLHGDRRRAFSSHGTGWDDPGNVIWKALDLHPSAPIDKLVSWKHEENADPGEAA